MINPTRIALFNASLVVFPMLVQGQPPGFGWEHLNTTLYYPEEGHLCARGPDELYVVQSGSGTDLIRYDRGTGNPVWTVGIDTITANFGVKPIGTDGVIVAGANAVYYDVARFDSNGAPVWHHNVNLGSGDNWELGGFVCDAQENTYFTYYSGANFEHTHVAKFDVAGNLLWDYEYQPSFLDNHPHQIRLDNQGNVLVGGKRRYNSMPFDEKAFLLKMDPQGQLLWDTTFVDASYYNHVNDILVLPNDQVLLTISDSNGSNDGGSVVAYSGAGLELWSYTAGAYIKPWAFVQDGQGTYVFAVDADNNIMRLLKFAPNGTVLMDEPLVINQPRSVVPIAEHRILIGHFTPGGGGFKDMTFTAIDTTGNVEWNLTYPSVCFDCYPPPPWPMIAPDPMHVYTTGSKSAISERGFTLEIYIPCVPEVAHCLDPAYVVDQIGGTQAQLGDMDNDGYTDLLTTVGPAQTLLVHSNTAGSFTMDQTIDLPYMGSTIRVADLNSDGWKDALVAEDVGEHVMVLHNTAGVLTYVGELDALYPLDQIELAETDGMNGPDVVARFFAGPMTEVHVFRNTGSGTFDPLPVVHSLPDVVRYMDVGDVDQDGLDDLAVIGWNTFGKLYRALGGGVYGAGTDIAPDGEGVTIRDLDDDGWRDVVVAGPGQATVSMNQSGSGFIDEVWTLPGLGHLGIPHPFPGDTSTRYFLPDLADDELGLLAWSDCASAHELFLLTGANDVQLFAADVTGDAGVDLLAFRPWDGEVWIAPNCDHTGSIGIVENGAGSFGMSVHPVPSSGPVSIKIPPNTGRIDIRDAVGRSVLRMLTDGRSTLNLLLDDQASGVYHVIASGTYGIATSTLMLVR